MGGMKRFLIYLGVGKGKGKGCEEGVVMGGERGMIVVDIADREYGGWRCMWC